MRKIKYCNGYEPDIYKFSDEDNTRFLLGNSGDNTMMCFGINPSFACLEFSDPTMNELIKQSQLLGYDSCLMMNPYPLRGPKPIELPQEANSDLIEKNIRYIEKVFQNHKGQNAYAMWGDFISQRKYFALSVISIYELSKEYNIHWNCIGTLTKQNNPRHFSWLIREYNKIKDESIFKPNSFEFEKYAEYIKKYI